MSWPTVKFDSVCSTVTKGTTPTSIGYEFSEAGVPFLRVQNIKSNTVSIEDVLYVDETTHNVLERSKVNSGDLLLTIAGTIGRVAIVPDDLPEMNCNQAVAIIRFDQNVFDSRFLLHWLSSGEAIRQISGKKVTGTISNLSLSQIKELEIPLPPLAEQKRIAAILDKADAIRQKRKQAIDLADEFLRSVFLDMFGDPVTNPKGWEKVELRRLLDSIDSGRSPKCESRPAIGDEWAVLKVSAVTSGEYACQENKAYLDSPDLISRYEVKAGDVLFTRKNTHKLVAAVSYVFESEAKRTMPDLIFRLIVKDEAVMNKLYLWGLLSCGSQRSEIQALAGGAAGSMPNISKANLFGVRVPVPSIELQKQYSDIVFKHRASVSKLAETLKYEEILFNALSQKAFSGEL